jgi:hypothetical protein
MEALAQFMSEDHGTLVDSEQFMGLEEAIDEVDLENVRNNVLTKTKTQARRRTHGPSFTQTSTTI